MSDVLVTHPLFGSVWLSDARLEGDFVVGETWDYGGVGSALMPDDFRGEPVTMNFPKTCIRKVEGELAP